MWLLFSVVLVLDVGCVLQGVLMPVEDLQSVHACLQVYLNHYNEEFGNVHLDIMLSENIICHIIKIHRVLSMQNK